MKFRTCIHKRLHRVANAERQAAEANVERERVEAMWPEVRRLSMWAKSERERNHFTDIIISISGGRP